MVVQWLELQVFTVMGPDSIPGQGTKILKAMWSGKKEKRKENCGTSYTYRLCLHYGVDISSFISPIFCVSFSNSTLSFPGKPPFLYGQSMYPQSQLSVLRKDKYHRTDPSVYIILLSIMNYLEVNMEPKLGQWDSSVH